MGRLFADNGYKAILEDLCHLEINTIRKENITGQKMPAPEIALVDLAESYIKKLSEKGEKAPGMATGGPVQYKHIQASASKVLGARTIDSDAEYWIIARIRNHASEILRIFQAVEARTGAGVQDCSRDEAIAHPIELLTKEVIMLRKAWDLGLEEVALQTIIQLDGDIIHRVQPQYAKEEFRPLLASHMDVVHLSVSYWGTLIGIIGQLVGGAVRLLGLRG